MSENTCVCTEPELLTATVKQIQADMSLLLAAAALDQEFERLSTDGKVLTEQDLRKCDAEWASVALKGIQRLGHQESRIADYVSGGGWAMPVWRPCHVISREDLRTAPTRLLADQVATVTKRLCTSCPIMWAIT